MPNKTLKIVILNIVFQYKYLNIKIHLLGKQTDLKYVLFLKNLKLRLYQMYLLTKNFITTQF